MPVTLETPESFIHGAGMTYFSGSGVSFGQLIIAVCINVGIAMMAILFAPPHRRWRWVSLVFVGLSLFALSSSAISIFQYAHFLVNGSKFAITSETPMRIDNIQIPTPISVSDECAVDCAKAIVNAGLTYVEVKFVPPVSPLTPPNVHIHPPQWLRFTARIVNDQNLCTSPSRVLMDASREHVLYCITRDEIAEPTSTTIGQKVFTTRTNNKAIYHVELRRANDRALIVMIGSFYSNEVIGLGVLRLFEPKPLIEDYPVVQIGTRTVFASNPLALTVAWNSQFANVTR